MNPATNPAEPEHREIPTRRNPLQSPFIGVDPGVLPPNSGQLPAAKLMRTLSVTIPVNLSNSPDFSSFPPSNGIPLGRFSFASCYKLDMSISGYFAPRTVEFRMPKTADPLDIRFEGPVLTGEKSVQQRQRDDAIAACNTAGESYKKTEDYDPVLRAHLVSSTHVRSSK